MKTIACLVLLISTLAGAVDPDLQKEAAAIKEIVLPVVTTASGKEYHHVRIVRWLADTVGVSHDGGAATLELNELPNDLRSRIAELAIREGKQDSATLKAQNSAAREQKKAMEDAKKKAEKTKAALSMTVTTVVNSSAAMCKVATVYRDSVTGALIKSANDSETVYVENLASPVAGDVYSTNFYRIGRLHYSSLIGKKIVARWTPSLSQATEWWMVYNGSDDGDVTYEQVNK